MPPVVPCLGGAPLACSLAPQHSSVIFVPRVTDISGIRDLGFFRRCWRKVMNTTFHSYRAPVWSGLKNALLSVVS